MLVTQEKNKYLLLEIAENWGFVTVSVLNESEHKKSLPKIGVLIKQTQPFHINFPFDGTQGTVIGVSTNDYHAIQE